jgi:hypothetical protein
VQFRIRPDEEVAARRIGADNPAVALQVVLLRDRGRAGRPFGRIQRV